ncbi:MAG: dephospho-CoA kinase [Acetobacteraceae bacterium]|nr:dephospho-CoA kinase [Acetobacteraceae bacterium]MBV8591742.1 dephospho-CoA kinase [Acetobacteraceae bacterium]
MKIIGLTGGIGMGKSTAANILRRAGIPVFDADAAVHGLQACGARAVRKIAALFPDAVVKGAVDRGILRGIALSEPGALQKLEAILHPMVRKEENRFLARCRRAGKRLAVLDIPLLFETGGDKRVDHVLVVTAPRDVQIHRLRLRGRMTQPEIAAFIAKQMPDRDKRRRADSVVKTGLSRHYTQRRLRALLRKLLV